MARPAKKSESLEIRIPHATKAAFMARCQAEGGTASETVRAFIEAQLAETDPTAARARRPWLRTAVGAAAAVGVAATALPSIAGTLERAKFDQMDTNRDGSLDPAEFSYGTGVNVRIEAVIPGLGELGFNLGRRRTPDGALRSAILQGAFQELDRNSDGVLSFAEFRGR